MHRYITKIHINAISSIILLAIIQVVILIQHDGQILRNALSSGCGTDLPFVFAPTLGIVVVAKMFAGTSNGSQGRHPGGCSNGGDDVE